MKVVIVGTGGIADLHCQSLRKLGIEIAGVLGVDEAQVRHLKDKYQISKTYESLSAIKESIDGVHICTPPKYHFDYSKFCLNNNIPLISEKPLCSNIEQSKELYDLSKNKKAAINFNNRYLNIVSIVKERLVDKEIISITGHYFQGFHLLPADFSWRYTEKMRAVSEIGSHYFDLVRYITGEEILEVFSVFKNTKKEVYLDDNKLVPYKTEVKAEVENEDIAFVICKLSGGSLVNISLSEINHARVNEIVLDINAGDESFLINLEQPYKIISANSAGKLEETFPFTGGFTSTFEDFFEDFYYAKGSKYATFEDGLINHKIMEAVYRSSRSGKFEKVQ